MRIASLLVLFVLLVGATGCQTKARLSRTNDALRLEREALRDTVESLDLINAELRSKLAESEQSRGTGTPSEVIDALPRTAGLRLTRFSGIDSDSSTAIARLFVVPIDGRGRFVQTAGSLSVRVINTGRAGSDPTVLAELAIEPSELRDAYVVGLSGPAYRIELALPAWTDGSVAARVVLDDLVTGLSHEAETILSVDPGSDGGLAAGGDPAGDSAGE